MVESPGPDGISLREAIEASNNDPGTHTIGFASVLRGKTIGLRSELPQLTGGGVTIEGAGVTLDARRVMTGVRISSSRNRLHALTLKGSDYGVVIEPPGSRKTHDFANHQTFADNSVSGVVIRGIRLQGIVLDATAAGNCGAPCAAHNRWVSTSISGNTVEAQLAGIFLAVASSGDRLERTTVSGNTIRIGGAARGPGVGISTTGESTGARVSDVLVARNSIEGSPDIGVQVAVGTYRAKAGVGENVRILDNQFQLVRRGSYFCCQGIVVDAGSDSPESAIGPPVRYLDGNSLRDVLVRGNKIRGPLAWGVSVQAGNGGGGSRNRVEGVRLERNAITSSTLGVGVFLWAGAGGPPYGNRIATANRVSRVTVASNRIALGGAVGSQAPAAGGIALLSGDRWGRDNTVSCVRASGNRITGATSAISIRVGAPGNRATLGC